MRLGGCGTGSDALEALDAPGTGRADASFRPDICDLPVDPGHCKAYIVRYYYNRATNRCQKFIYGGCKGNGNNFKTLEQCQKTCVGEWEGPGDVCRLPRDPGPCKAFRTRTFYNVTSKACERFQYGGCGGNKNNFVNPELCLRTCQRPGGVCTLPADGGLCFMLEERWYFDHEEKKCQPFSWGGCGGNENNFGSRPECESACSPYGKPRIDPRAEGRKGGYHTQP
uniref:BPTI/Kunitz inhibitor domain-containing protein n=1 Tax=Varanus komodoensis TaxID=61221 RepID=A0A8D2KZ06_VARKO